MKRYVPLAFLSCVLTGSIACDSRFLPNRAQVETKAKAAPAADAAVPAPVGPPLYASSETALTFLPPAPRPGKTEPVFISDCHLAIIEKQDVPSQRDGVLLFIGTPVQENEPVAADRIMTAKVGAEEKKIRTLREGDTVQAGQLLAQLDDRFARDDLAIKDAKITAAKADLAATEKTREEAKRRYETEQRMAAGGPGITTPQDLSGAKLALDRYIYEAVNKTEEVKVAERERNQAQTVLEMHQIYSKIRGVVKMLYKKPGEAVKSYEPVLQIQNSTRLQAEGLVDRQYLDRLRLGMRVVIQPSQIKPPEQTLLGHLQEVNSVAVSKDPINPAAVSGSEDGTVRVWDLTTRRERLVLRHPAAIRAVACTPPGAAADWCLSGAADGIARLWNLAGDGKQPVREFKGQHHGALTCVAFSPDGKLCATGGDDRVICLWDAATGELRYRLPANHGGAITSLQFLPQAQLVSVGSDNTWRLWTLGQQGARLETTLDHRSGDVTSPGISRDGKHALFDQGKTLRILTLPDCLTEGVLEATTGASNFTAFALFSPDASLILTAGASEGRLQVWRAPAGGSRGYELCQLVNQDHSPATCASFAPNGSFLVTGTRDRRVLVWPVPTRNEIDRQLTGEVTLIEHSVESTAGQVRIWADLPNPDGTLLAGTPVTMVINAGEGQ